MPASDHSPSRSFRKLPADGRSWREAFVFLAVIGGLIGLGFAARGLSAPKQAVLWGAVVLALAVFGRRGWLKLFGPVLFYDLIRTSRRTRYFLIRTVYTSFLLALLIWLYLMWAIDLRNPGGSIRADQMANFAGSFFYMFMGVQFTLVTLLTPAATAGAIAEEKERKTLEFLLVTDLDNREIVLSKLLSRLFNLSLLIFAGLPVLSFLQFLGGVDPGLVLAGFVATGLTAASLAGLSIFYSAVSKRARDAILLTYLTSVAYLILSGLSWLLVAGPFGLGTFPSTTTWSSPVTLQDLVEWFNAGNPISALVQLTTWISGGSHIEEILSGILFQYAIFHGLVAMGGPLWAIWRLRTVAIKETYGKERKLSLWVRLVGRPQVSDRPMLWKEIFAEPGLRFHWLARVTLLVLVVASFLPPGLILGDYYFGQPRSGPAYWTGYEWIRQELNVWVRVIGTTAACLSLLGVAVRAAGAISGERDHKTFDELLTTPLSSREILFAKWVGSVLNVRWAWLWLGLIWILGVATGSLHAAALPLLSLVWLIYAAVFAGVGLWCSMTCRSTLRAVVWTLFMVLVLSVGHWAIMGSFCYIPLSMMHVSNRDIEWLTKLQAGFTPPFVLAYLAFYENDIGSYRSIDGPDNLIFFVFFGVVFWVFTAVILWEMTNKRFQSITGRVARIPPIHGAWNHTKPPMVETAVAGDDKKDESLS